MLLIFEALNYRIGSAAALTGVRICMEVLTTVQYMIWAKFFLKAYQETYRNIISPPIWMGLQVTQLVTVWVGDAKCCIRKGYTKPYQLLSGSMRTHNGLLICWIYQQTRTSTSVFPIISPIKAATFIMCRVRLLIYCLCPCPSAGE